MGKLAATGWGKNVVRIDSHQHFWVYSPADYPWIQQGTVLERSFLPNDLVPLLQTAGIDSCIAVQARQSLSENAFLSQLVAENETVGGFVGWIDLRSADVERQAQEMKNLVGAVGVRHVVQDEPDLEFMSRDPFRRGIAALRPHKLVYDILIYERQLDDAIRLVRDFPDQTFVLDHIAKPKIKSNEIQVWRSKMVELSHYGNVSVKLSGMLTEADQQTWTLEQLLPYWEVVLEAFGTDRILYGSDWPVVLLAGEYTLWVEIVTQWLSRLSEPDRGKIWGGNAERIYFGG